MASPRISIVTPSFQQAAFLRQTIESVLSQEIDGLEYLIVDGGSTDGSVDLIRSYEKQLTWWVSEPDQGQADAINKGLARVNGDIVAWLNSDDYYMPGILNDVLEYFDHHPEVGLIYGDVLAVDENNTPINLMRFGDWGLTGLTHFEIIGQPAVFFRKSALDKSGCLDTRFHFLLDHHLWLRIASIAPVRYLPKTLAGAHYHPQAKNVARAAEFGQDAYRILEWMQSEPRLKVVWEKDKKNIMAGAIRFDAYYLAEGEFWTKAFKAYLRSFWLFPAGVTKDWKRFLFTIINLVGLKALLPVAQNLRQQKRNENLNSERVQ
jgi:glycosyltransferase involved in cell wall biosynthesis